MRKVARARGARNANWGEIGADATAVLIGLSLDDELG